jgi:hypothetical protein
MVITVDFDGTLSRKDVQHFIKGIINDNIFKVVVVTSRFECNRKEISKGYNDDIFKVVKDLDLNVSDIIFTNREFKFKAIKELGAIVHLDDYFLELNKINQNTKCVGICVFRSSNWISKTRKILRNYVLEKK